MINNLDIEARKNALFQSSSARSPASREELLARHLAESLDDQAGLPFYRFCVRKYPEDVLRSTLNLVHQVPQREIRKSRGALFNYLIHRHEPSSQNRPRD